MFYISLFLCLLNLNLNFCSCVCITVSPGTTTLPVAQCGCGQCAYVDIIYHRCNVQRDGVTFPFINTEEMSDTERDLLMHRLVTESHGILHTFDHFWIQINTWLQQNVSLKMYKEILQSITAFEALNGQEGSSNLLTSRCVEISAAQEHQTLHNIVKEYVNWFNYELLEEIVNRACQKLEIDRNNFGLNLTSYVTDLHLFCKRCIYECPIPEKDLKKHSKYLCVKVQMAEESIKIKANKIREFQGGLRIALGLASYTLKLCLVADGCVEVLFSIPTSIHTVLFPLSSDALPKLIPLGVMKICTHGYVVEWDKNSSDFNVMPDNVSIICGISVL